MKHSVRCSGREFLSASYLSFVAQLVRKVGIKNLEMKCHTSITEYVFCTFLSYYNLVYKEKREKSLFFYVRILTTVKADSFARTTILCNT